MKVRVLKGPFGYGMEYRRAGDEFEMPDHVAAVFIKSGAVAAATEEQKRRRVYRRRDAQPAQRAVMTAEPEKE